MRDRLTRWMLADAGLDDAAALRMFGPRTRGPRAVGVLLHVLLACVLITVAMVGARAFEISRATISAQAFASLYWPTLIGQAIVSAGVFALGLNVIPALRRKGTWDQVRTTAGGSRAAVRAAWAHVVYQRMSGWMAVLVYAPRVFLLGLLLYDLTSFRGDYLAQIMGVHVPRLAPALDIPIMGLIVTAAFVLPLTAFGLEAAFALLVSTFFQTRQALGMVQALVTVLRVAWAALPALLFIELSTRLSAGDTIAALDGWVTGLASTLLGDWGFSGLHGAEVDHMWSHVPYAALIPAVAVVAALVQSGLTLLTLNWTARRAQLGD